MTAFFEKIVLGTVVPILLIGSGVFFLFYLRFFFLIKPSVFYLLKKQEKKRGVSPFAALTVALAGTLGVGNIVGVAGAILLGGPGAVFWMIVSAAAAMVLKYGEIVLARRHGRSSASLHYGGAMYYMEDYFREKRAPRLGKFYGGAFALLCLLNSVSMGCMLQANAVSSSFSSVSRIPYYIIGAVLVILVGFVLLKNIYDISSLTTVIIPVMTAIYVILSAVVIFRFRERLPYTALLILKNAFSLRSAGGGLAGSAFAAALHYGCMRGLLSNEAGCGTAPMAHASSGNALPAVQGLWGIIEVFVDTVLLCTLTALSILLVTGGELSGYTAGDEMKLVLISYGTALGRYAPLCMTVMVFFFAYATIICWAYYGLTTLRYLTKSRTAEKMYKLLFLICVFFGCGEINLFVWQLSDFSLGMMTIINLIVLLLMRKEIRSETERILP